MKKKTNKQSIDVHIPVTMLSSSWKGDFEKLPANRTYELIIDYPLQKPAKYKIKTGKAGMGLVALLGTIGKFYEKTYEDEDAYEPDDEDEEEDGHLYGIYGHDIGDLNLSGVNVDHDKLTITLYVDS